MLSERRGSFRPQPKETVPYEVQPSDTLEGIAARYNITPSELTVLNKLSSRTVFPGQTIYIPEKNSLQVLEQILKQSAAAINASSNEQSSPKPGHVERVPSIAGDHEGIFDTCQASDVGNVSDIKSKILEDGNKESLRINSKYVTDGEGVVSGVLIVTTNHIIFDPNVSDPLVIEYGMEKYGVEAPMACIIRAALYTDIFRIKKDSQVSIGEQNANLYHSKNILMKKSKSQGEKLGKIEKSKRRYSSAEVGSKRLEFGVTFSNSFQDNLSKICENTDPEEENGETNILHTPHVSEGADVFTQQENQSSVTEESKNRTIKGVLSASSSFDSDEGPASRKTSISDDDLIMNVDSGSPKKKSNFEKTKHKLHKGLKKLSLTDGLFSHPHSGRRMSLPAFTSLPDFKTKSSNVKSSIDKHAQPFGDQDKNSSSGTMYVNMVEEKPELFAPLDKLIPRPAKSFCDTPLYLCLRMGHPVDKSLERVSSVVHFGQKMKPEYWFSIPKDSVDGLYCFFLRWCPEKYGDIDKIDLDELGFTPVESDQQEELEEKVTRDHRRASWAFPWRRKSRDVSEMTAVSSSPEDWEFLDYLGSDSDAVHPPELLTPSNILNDEQILAISKHLPARAMNSWTLIYGNVVHGFSLKTMYREMTKFDCPVLIVVANRNHAIFGAFLSSPLKMSDHFYGTGESFLFTFSPEFKVFHWSGENNYFIKGNTDSFIVGSSEGHFGLWLDDDLFRGRTNSCQTFANEPLCAEEDFEVKSLEAWGFV